MRKKINRYFSHEFGIGSHDLDIRFTAFGTKYRIPQFCIMWNIIRCLQVVSMSVMMYWIIVCTITIGGSNA